MAETTEPVRTPRFRLEAPDDWTQISLHPTAAAKDIKKVIAAVTWPNLHLRASVRDQMEQAVGDARAAGALLFMIAVDAVTQPDGSVELFVGTLTVAPIGTAPEIADLSMVDSALTGAEGEVTPLAEGDEPLGRLLASVDKTDPSVAAWRPELRETSTAQAYRPVPEQPWVIVATCSINGADRLGMACAVAKRLALSVEPVEG